MIRPQAAPRAMCRRADSAIISAAAIASTLNCCRQVSAVTRGSDRPSRSVPADAKVSASHPLALYTRMSTGPRCSTAAPNRAPGARVRHVGLHRERASSPGPDLLDDRRCVARAVIPVGLRNAGIGRIGHPQVRAQHRAAAPRERQRDGGPDAMVGTGHDRRVAIGPGPGVGKGLERSRRSAWRGWPNAAPTR
jgi:hypothetical protein